MILSSEKPHNEMDFDPNTETINSPNDDYKCDQNLLEYVDIELCARIGVAPYKKTSKTVTFLAANKFAQTQAKSVLHD